MKVGGPVAGESFAAYAARALRIRPKRGSVVAFELNEPQLRLEAEWRALEAAGKPVRIIVLKARQEGVSTWGLGRLYARCAGSRGVTGYLVAHDADSTRDLFDAVRLMHDESPEDQRPDTIYSTKTEIDFRRRRRPRDTEEERADTGLSSRIRIGTANQLRAGRSRTIQHLHCSEVAFWPSADLSLLSLLNAVPNQPGTAVILESTANGVGGEFYRIWQEASNPSSGSEWVAVFLPWWDFAEYALPLVAGKLGPIPEGVVDVSAFEREEKILVETLGLSPEQINWRRHKIRHDCGNSLDRFRQEYPATPEEAFIVSGRPVFNREMIAARMLKLQGDDRRRRDAGEPPRFEIGDLFRTKGGLKFVPSPSGSLRVYARPEPLGDYLGAGDVAEGYEAAKDDPDYSTAHIYDRHTGHQVAALDTRKPPAEYARDLYLLGRWYNWALLAPEANNHGYTVITLLRRWEYPRLWIRRDWDGMSDRWVEKYGWQTTAKTRPLMIDALSRAITENLVGLNDLPTLAQLTTFVRHSRFSTAATRGANRRSPRMEAQSGCHDDHVIPACIACAVMGFAEQPEPVAERIESHLPEFERAVAKDLRQIVAEAKQRSLEAFAS